MRNKNKNISKMKQPKKIKAKSHQIKNKMIKKPKTTQKEKVLVVAQEIKFARLLCGNEKKTRDRVLKTLKKWLTNCFQKGHEFKEDDFIRVWKGLFYAVWMSDKPLIQEELCENISGILDQFPPEQIEYAVMMVKAGLQVLATEWYGIDHHRMDKFLMLVRRYLRGSLRCLHRCDWSLTACRMYSKMLSASDGILSPKTPHYARNATSMIMHFVDCFIEELAKVSSGSVPDSSMVELLKPFINYMCLGDTSALCTASRRLLTVLLRQSEVGMEYEHATAAWKMMGCPRGGPEALELETDDDEEGDEDSDVEQDSDDGEKPLDPRAGHVDVELPNLPVPARKVADELRKMLTNTASKAHKRTKICLERFEKLAKDEYPLPVEEVYEEGEEPATWRPTKAARDLKRTERKLVEDADELALRGLSRKHRKRLLAKSRAGASIVEDVAELQKKPRVTNGDWKVENTDETKIETCNKENERIKKRKRKDTQTEAEKQKTNDAKKLKAEKKKNERKINMIVNKRDNKLKKIQNNAALADSIKTFFENRQTGKDSAVENEAKTIKVTEAPNKIKNEAKIIKVTEAPNKIKNEPKTMKVTEAPNKIKNEPKTIKVIDSNKNKTKVKAMKSTDKMVSDKQSKTTVKSVQEVSAKQDTSEKHGTTVKSVKVKNEPVKNPTLVVKKVKNFQKQTTVEKKRDLQKIMSLSAPKRVQFSLQRNSSQLPAEYWRAVRARPGLPYDARRRPARGSLKTAAPAHRNPFASNRHS